MNNQTDLIIIPENAGEFYDLNKIMETADSIYWTWDIPDLAKDWYYKIYLVIDE